MVTFIAALSASSVAYLGLAIFEPLFGRTDRERWDEVRSFSTILAIGATVCLVWIAILSGPGASLDSILDRLFRRPRAVTGFLMASAIAFSAAANVHVLVLRYLENGRARNDA